MEESTIEPLFVTLRTGSRITGLGHTKLYELLDAGAIESVKVGGRRLIKYESLKKIGTPVPAKAA